MSTILVLPADFSASTYAIAQSLADEDKLQQTIDEQETITLYKLLGKALADLLITYIQLSKPIQTAGPLVVGKVYLIKTYITGDDFTNVGAASNASGVYFTATGTTPTVYTQQSVLQIDVVKRYDDIINSFYLKNDAGGCWEFRKASHMNSHGLKDLLDIQVYYTYITGEQLLHTQSGVASQSVENGRIQPLQNVFRKAEYYWNGRGLDTWYAVNWFCKYKYPELYPEFDGEMQYARSGSIL